MSAIKAQVSRTMIMISAPSCNAVGGSGRYDWLLIMLAWSLHRLSFDATTSSSSYCHQCVCVALGCVCVALGSMHDVDVNFAVVWNKPSTKTLKLDLNYSSNHLIIRQTT